jgi:hypothetical protein
MSINKGKTGLDNRVLVSDASSGRLLRELTQPSNPIVLCWLRPGPQWRLAIGRVDGIVIFCTFDKNGKILKETRWEVGGITFRLEYDPGFNRLLVGFLRSIAIYELDDEISVSEEGDVRYHYSYSGTPMGLGFLLNGSRCIVTVKHDRILYVQESHIEPGFLNILPTRDILDLQTDKILLERRVDLDYDP